MLRFWGLAELRFVGGNAFELDGGAGRRTVVVHYFLMWVGVIFWIAGWLNGEGFELIFVGAGAGEGDAADDLSLELGRGTPAV